MQWQPSASLETIQKRAQIYQRVRTFFSAREFLEVDTPLLSRATNTDAQIVSIEVLNQRQQLFLQTSPEFAMKRLLAAGSGSIYQICHAFRGAEDGRLHNTEFTLLEWYRVDFDLFELMNELGLLLIQLLASHEDGRCCEFISYQQVWLDHVGIDPHSASLAEFEHCAGEQGLTEAASLCGNDVSVWLDFLFSMLIQPRLGRNAITFVYDYPVWQASLARIRSGQPAVAERFEVFIEGIELANGFHELNDADEQQRRFQHEQQLRQALGLFVPKQDQRLLAALRQGLPDCSGVAVGLDRVLMLIAGREHINEVLSFPVSRA